MFGRKKNFSLPANAKLVCVSEEEYKNLLREEIALKLLTDAMRERDGCYEVPSHEVHAIGYAMAKHFDPTWEKAKQESGWKNCFNEICNSRSSGGKRWDVSLLLRKLICGKCL